MSIDDNIDKIVKYQTTYQNMTIDMTTKLPKRIVDDRTHILSAILNDMETMTPEEFTVYLKEHTDKFKFMEMVSKKITKGPKPFKLISVTPWTLYSNEYIADKKAENETLTIARCGELRIEAAGPWKSNEVNEVNHETYHRMAAERNAQNYKNWQDYYADKDKTDAEISVELKSVDNIKTMKRKEIFHIIGSIPLLRNNCDINQTTKIKALRKYLTDEYKRINEITH